jgi:hypothetical protein
MASPATTLGAAISTTNATTATVRDVSGFATSAESDDLIQIDSEYMLVSGGLGTTSWSSITRAYAGSTAATHADASIVYRLERSYTDASRLQVMSKASSADYSYLRDCASQANSWLIGEVGRFYGPSTDTSRTYDVEGYPREILIPGGVRSVTTLEYRTIEGDSLSTVTASDYVLRPKSWDLIDGLTYDRIELINQPASITSFYPGKDMVKVTSSTFGPASPPNALRAVADKIGWWLYQSRAAGQGGIIGSSDTGELVQLGVLSPGDWRTIKLYRGVGPSLYAMPAF